MVTKALKGASRAELILMIEFMVVMSFEEEQPSEGDVARKALRLLKEIRNAKRREEIGK